MISTVFTAYEIRQGTIEQLEAEREWVLSHYTRTARKRNALSGLNLGDRSEERPTRKFKR
jgi:U3 small nucleolar ribonucleoprotein protein IMP4